jgi:hypothetical protein
MSVGELHYSYTSDLVSHPNAKFTRRGRCNGVVSRETTMRPRSRCNAWFGGSALEVAQPILRPKGISARSGRQSTNDRQAFVPNLRRRFTKFEKLVCKPLP